ncbi:unnamed protein product [Adineta steineri]|uniref:Uncharacterized protein n=1 Tax=Adineta steineri TaxID=433720 RepID=A0A818LHN8_9BILA|nr:unnamed protein product [Adineta steineri]
MAEDQNVAPSILEDNYYPFHDYYFHARNDNDEPTTDLELTITNRLWLNAHTNYDCDVLLTFPARIDNNVIIWYLEKFLQLESDIRISIKYHFTTDVYGFYLTFTYERILKDADALQLEKPIKQEFSGGYCSSIKCALLGSSRKS